MTQSHPPRTGSGAHPDTPDEQPVVDAFTDVPQAAGERPIGNDVEPDDMGVQGGE